MKLLIYLICFIFLINISNGLVINEIMADPFADETLNEWIELYNDEPSSINVSFWIIGDGKDNDTLEGGLYHNEGTIIPGFGFAIITDDATRVYNNFNVSSDAIRLYVNDASIGNGLSNDGETISLYDINKIIIDRKTYTKTTEDLSWSFINNSLFKSNPTPGFTNDETLLSGCDYAIGFILTKTVFENSSEFSFKIRASKVSGSSTNFTSRAKIEDLNGKLIREYKPFTNQSITRQRTSTEYTPNLEEGKSYIMNSNITLQCNDTNTINNFDIRIITIKGKPLREDSSIDIEKIFDLGTDNIAKFGQTIRVKLNAYKGNTNKKSVALYIEDDDGNRLSKQSKTNLDLKYTNYSLTIPVQIKPNCNEKFKDDEYILIAKGIDSEDKEEFDIEELTDSLCEVKVVEQKKVSTKKLKFDLQEFNDKVEVGKEYKTKILLDNNNDVNIPIRIWSYVYRGSKSYSGDREENIKEFILEGNSLNIIELTNMVDEAESGTYKFKVLINKNDQKTNSDITRDVILTNNANNDQNNIPDTNVNKNQITNNIMMNNFGFVYESSTEKTKSLIPIFLIILLTLLCIVLIWKR